MPGIKIGDEKVYHESGVLFKVKVLDIQEKEYGKTPGEEYKLRLLEVIDANGFQPPEKGLEFSVWKARESGGYAGWHLLDR